MFRHKGRGSQPCGRTHTYRRVRTRAHTHTHTHRQRERERERERGGGERERDRPRDRQIEPAQATGVKTDESGEQNLEEQREKKRGSNGEGKGRMTAKKLITHAPPQ